MEKSIKELQNDVYLLKQSDQEIKEELSHLRDEIIEIKKEIVKKAELMEMEQRFTNSIDKIREALRLSLIDIHDDLEEIRFKVKFYVFDFLLKRNDHLAGVLKEILQERKSLSKRMKDFEERLKIVEAK